ncbi:arylesterase [bacterium]|nr:arylesterase [bacterium]
MKLFYLFIISWLFFWNGPPSYAASKTILFLGDSLTAGYGLSEDQAYPALIQQKLHQDRMNWTVINGGVSGDTSKNGLTRLQWALKSKPDLVVVALGANDGLRGMPVSEMGQNLTEIIRQSKASGARVALMGVKIPTSYGSEYTRKFEDTFDDVARKTQVPYLPFFISAVATKKNLNLADGIHPNAAGHRKVAVSVYTFIKPILKEMDSKPKK